MTKEEAIEKLNEGFKITHKHFLKKEYIVKNNDRENELLDESDDSLNFKDFFNNRDGKTWNNDWSVWRIEKTEEKLTKNPHYNNYPQETIDMMLTVFGKKAFKNFCLLNAFKYRMRMGTKENGSIEKDLIKEKYYLEKYKNIK